MSAGKQKVIFSLGAQLAFGFVTDTDELKYTIVQNGAKTLLKVIRNPKQIDYVGFPDFGIAAVTARELDARIAQELFERMTAVSERVSIVELMQDLEGGMGANAGERASEELLELSSSVNHELYDALKRVAKLLRWRGNGDGGHEPLRRISRLHFSMDRARWFAAPSSFSLVTFGRKSSVFDSQAHHDVVAMLSNALSEEPIGHNLIREAETMVFDNPRSATVMAVAALEVALKSFLSSAHPVTRWFVEQKRTPPVHEMLVQLLPMISPWVPASADEEMFPKEIRKTIQDAVTARNEVVHRSKGDITPLSAKAFVEAVRNSLWLLDYYSGLVWARKYVDEAIAIPNIIPNPLLNA